MINCPANQLLENTAVKSSIVPIAVVAMVALVIMWRYNQTIDNIQKTLDLERYQRISAEEKLQSAELKMGALNSELEQAREKLERIQKVLSEEASQREDLLTQVDVMHRERETLEQRIQELERLKQEGTANSAAMFPATVPEKQN